MSANGRVGGPARAVLRACSWLVPSGRRAHWLQEWRSELWHASRDRIPGGRTTAAYLWGAARHALWEWRQEWSGEMIGTEIRLALRTLLRSPGYAAMGLLALGLGIGASTALFSLVNGVLLAPLPYPEGDRIQVLSRATEDDPESSVAFTREALRDLQSVDSPFETLGGVAFNNFNLTGGLDPVQIRVGTVTEGFFETFGLDPIIGRLFDPSELARGDRSKMVLSHDLWVRQFGADPSILDTSVQIDGRDISVIGVLPAEFRWPEYAEALLPLNADGTEMGRPANLEVVGRLREGVDGDRAVADLGLVAARLARSEPERHAASAMSIQSLRDSQVGWTRRPLLLLLGSALLVLFIACANVSHMQMARAARTEREAAIRSSLGGSRLVIARSVLVESCILGLGGGLLGLAVAYWVVPAVLLIAPFGLVPSGGVSIDLSVFAFAASAAILTGVLFGVRPALRSAHADLQSTLRAGAVGLAGKRRRGRWRGGLIASEVALATVLLVGGMLLLRSLRELNRIDPGLDPAGLLVVGMVLPEDAYPTTADLQRFDEELQARLLAEPAISAASAVNFPELSGMVFPIGVDGASASSVQPEDEIMMEGRAVLPGHFATLGQAITRGRGVEVSDRNDSQPVAVVNETLARRIWGQGAEPVGETLTFETFGQSRTAVVVGVADDIRATVREPGVATVYLPMSQWMWRYQNWVVRARSGDATAIQPVVQNAIWALDPVRPVFGVGTMESRIEAQVSSARFTTILMGLFAAISIVLAAIGIYGVVAHSVANRTKEIGVRMALGADRASITSQVMGEGSRPIVAGALLGFTLALAGSRVLSSLLFGVNTTDPLSLGLVALTVAGAGALATWAPTLRAASVSPTAALKEE